MEEGEEEEDEVDEEESDAHSSEDNDDFIADFAVGIAADFIKSGAPARGERLAKYNRLVKIEEEIMKK